MTHAQRIAKLLDDPSTPRWARDTIHAALTVDPVDAANVLEVIAQAFRERAARIAHTMRPLIADILLLTYLVRHT